MSGGARISGGTQPVDPLPAGLLPYHAYDGADRDSLGKHAAETR